MEEYLYNAALESIHKYKEEELTDFDDFMDEMEKEYSVDTKQQKTMKNL